MAVTNITMIHSFLGLKPAWPGINVLLLLLLLLLLFLITVIDVVHCNWKLV